MTERRRSFLPPDPPDPFRTPELAAARSASIRAAILAAVAGQVRLERKAQERNSPPPPKKEPQATARELPEHWRPIDEFALASARLQQRQDEAIAYELRRLERQWEREDALFEQKMRRLRAEALRAKAERLLRETEYFVPRRRKR